MFKRIKVIDLLNVVTLIFFLLLPYFLFEGKLFIGGDDTRLFYSYPSEFFKNAAFFSWSNFSSIGLNVPNQFFVPFLTLWTILANLIKNSVILSYFGFSLPLILGFTYFGKLVKELFNFEKSDYVAIYCGSLFFILSPILIINQLFVFLTAIWLLALVPLVGFYYIRYLKTGAFINIYKSMLFCFFFSFALVSVPWLLGILLPIAIGSMILLLYVNKEEIVSFLKRSFTFFLLVGLPQAFWFIGFALTYLGHDKNSFANKFASQDFINTFVTTVQGTATGYVVYPLLNLFHRSIAFNFNWKLKNDFINFYDNFLVLNLIFVAVLIGGLLFYKKYLKASNRKIYLFVLASFLTALFLFTVNIGPLKDLFMFLGRIPGVVMFRNFYDKFAPGYVFIYAILITASLVIVKRRFLKVSNLIALLFLAAVLINFLPVKSTVNSPLWTTENIYKNITIPQEYTKLMSKLNKNVPSTNTILSVPYGVAAYTVIKDNSSDNVYVGTSPVRIFSGINDISGDLSFNLTEDAGLINQYILSRSYDSLNKVLFNHNINYVLLTKNIPKEVFGSYVFNRKVVNQEDDQFLKAITDKKIFTSANGNYELYTSKKINTLFNSRKITYKKINSVQYEIYLNLNRKEKIKFNDTFHSGWKLYIEKYLDPNCQLEKVSDGVNECKEEFKFFDFSELKFLWEKPIFDNSHTSEDGYSNIWRVDSEALTKNYDGSFFKKNEDGSIDVKLILYFKPQLYFYYGMIFSITVLILATIYTIKTKK